MISAFRFFAGDDRRREELRRRVVERRLGLRRLAVQEVARRRRRRRAATISLGFEIVLYWSPAMMSCKRRDGRVVAGDRRHRIDAGRLERRDGAAAGAVVRGDDADDLACRSA